MFNSIQHSHLTMSRKHQYTYQIKDAPWDLATKKELTSVPTTTRAWVPDGWRNQQCLQAYGSVSCSGNQASSLHSEMVMPLKEIQPMNI